MPTPARDHPPAGRPGRRSIGVGLLVIVLLGSYVAMALSAARSKSVAFDEPAHLAAGYAYWLKGDFRLQPENGNFPQRWATLPLLVSRPVLPPATDPAWQQPDVWGLGASLLNRPTNDPDQILASTRAMIALLGAATAALIFFWARSLHGTGGGFVALGLAVFCPALLAHGSLVTSDLAFAGVLLGATYAWWQLLQRITVTRFFLSVSLFALLFLTKMSAPLILPIALVLGFVRCAQRGTWPLKVGRQRAWRSRASIGTGIAALLLLHLMFTWGAIWAAYNFRFLPTPGSIPTTNPFAVQFDGELGWPIRLLHALDAARLLPKAYLFGYEFVWRASAYRYAFFNGDYGFGHWPGFFPYAFLVKMPLAFFPLFLVASIALVRRCATAAAWYPFAPLLTVIFVFGGTLVFARLNIGHRHLLPLLPPLYILAGAAWPALAGAPAWRRGGIAALVAAFALESWMIRPHYLAFFNRISGGPDQAWRHLVDSSLDWGMDLPALRDWLHDHQREKEPIHFGYFGMGTPADYGISAVSLTTYYGAETRGLSPLQPGLFVVSTTLLQVYAPAFGPWNQVYETRYQAASAAFARYYTATPAEARRLMAEKGDSYWSAEFRALNDLRCARLFAWLRHHPPVAQIAHTLLVWRLSDDDLRTALLEAPAEMAATPVALPPTVR